MPKTKKQSKPNKLLNSLKPNSPAKGMLLFAIAFAVIGGGYMAFRSFAATAAYVFDDASPTLVGFTNSSAPKPTTVLDSDTFASKNGTYSIALKSSGQGGGMYDSASTTGAKTVFSNYSSARTCAVVKMPSGGSANVEMQTVNDGKVYFYTVSGTTYHDVCTAWQSINKSLGMTIPGLLFDSGSKLYLHEIRLEAN